MDTCTVAHYWLVDAEPTRGSYHATCKICGKKKDFPEQGPLTCPRKTEPVSMLDWEPNKKGAANGQKGIQT
jgi:hypothetical protein